jgi:hypothetical protein
MADPKTHAAPACLKLRCKQMFYKDLQAPPTEHDRQVERLFGTSDMRVWWCECTQNDRGPDRKPVNLRECSAPDRTCYESLEDLA